MHCQPLGAILITLDGKIINRRDIFVVVFCEILPREQYDPSEKTGLALHHPPHRHLSFLVFCESRKDPESEVS